MSGGIKSCCCFSNGHLHKGVDEYDHLYDDEPHRVAPTSKLERKQPELTENVKAFITGAQSGSHCYVINPLTGNIQPGKYYLNKDLTTVRISVGEFIKNIDFSDIRAITGFDHSPAVTEYPLLKTIFSEKDRMHFVTIQFCENNRNSAVNFLESFRTADEFVDCIQAVFREYEFQKPKKGSTSNL
eukprot:Filipodium_phascolosomae@DN8342_c0_g1_i1.p1